MQRSTFGKVGRTRTQRLKVAKSTSDSFSSNSNDKNVFEVLSSQSESVSSSRNTKINSSNGHTQSSFDTTHSNIGSSNNSNSFTTSSYQKIQRDRRPFSASGSSISTNTKNDNSASNYSNGTFTVPPQPQQGRRNRPQSGPTERSISSKESSTSITHMQKYSSSAGNYGTKQPSLATQSAQVMISVVKGAGKDSTLSQTVGSHYLLKQEVEYLCSVINPTGLNSNNPTSTSLNVAAVQALLDLCLCVATNDVENRQVLYQSNKTMKNILDACANIGAKWIASKNNNNNNNSTLQSDHDNNRQVEFSDSQDSLESKPNILPDHVSKFIPAAISVLYTCMSLDCTLHKQSAFVNTPNNARRLRLLLLQHYPSLQVLYQLMVYNELIHELQGLEKENKKELQPDRDSQNESSLPLSVESSSYLSAIQEDSQQSQFSISTQLSFTASTIEDNNSQSQGSSSSINPVKIGRARKRRRLFQSVVPTAAADNELNNSALDSTPLSYPDSSNCTNKDSSVVTSSSPLSICGSTTGHSSSKVEQQLQNHMQSCLDKAFARVLMYTTTPATILSTSTIKESSSTHQSTCPVPYNDPLFYLPYIAVMRIINGRHEDTETSCLDEDNDKSTHHRNDQASSSSLVLDTTINTSHDDSNVGIDSGDEHVGDSHNDNVDDDDEEAHNPVLQTNRILNNSGVLPLLSQSMAQLLAAVLYQVRKDKSSVCVGCVQVLRWLLSQVSQLLDQACLLHDENRQVLCDHGYIAPQGCLVGGLIVTLHELWQHQYLWNDSLWGDVGLDTLQTLTSLTHDNSVAANEMTIKVSDTDCTGVEIIVRILQGTTKCYKAGDSKTCYDAILHCLNTLTNVIESGGIHQRRNIVELNSFDNDDSSDNNKKNSWLEWCTQWLVLQTEPFKDLVLSQEDNNSSSQPKSMENRNYDEQLLIAGNGFILLTFLLISENGQNSNSNSNMFGLKNNSNNNNSVQSKILSHIPGSSMPSKLGYMQNVLKAFCNFYRFSVGDLSLAITAPVQKLLTELDALVWRNNVW